MGDKKIIVKVCTGKNCKANFSEYILKRLKADKQRLNLEYLEIEESMCMGLCSMGPNVKINDEIINYAEPAKISDIVINGKKKKKKYNNKK